MIRISPKTVWLFVEIIDSAGVKGIGEATTQGDEAGVVMVIETLVPVLLRTPANPLPRLAWQHVARTRVGGAAASAVDSALWDIAGKRADIPLARLLGATTLHIPLYANVNRGLPSRSPGAFAAGARAAADAGFHAIKIAPFDEVDIHGRWGAPLPATRTGLDAGVARIAAVRTVIGADAALMVDCHWRFDEQWAERAIDAVADFRLHWVECPVPEDTAYFPAINRLRARANAKGMRLAGGEDGVGRESFLRFLAHDAYDVLMPDIKHVGGLEEMQAVAALAAKHGVAIAPHNPTGPIAHAASLHVCTVLPGLDRLELQFNESPLFESLVQPALLVAVGGIAPVPPGPGLGVQLAPDVLRSHEIEVRSWP